MKKTRLWSMMVFILSLVLLSGCGEENAASGDNDGKIQIVATTGMIADLAANIGGDLVEVEGLMGPGVDPHLYKATQGDMEKIDQAEMIFYNGLHLEGKMQDILEKMEKKKPVIAVTKDIEKGKLQTVEDNTFDPHIWFDVELWIETLDVVKDALIAEDKENKGTYEENYKAYKQELMKLDQYAADQLSNIPVEQRVLITAHDAFGYFGEAYGLEVRGLQGISTLSEYGSKDVTELRDFIVEKKIKAIFVESSVPKKAIQAVIEGAERKGHTVEVGGELFSDAMGENGTEEGTYIGMVKHNVDTITNALR